MPEEEIPKPGVILIVEDDQGLAELIKGLVQDLGSRPVIASTGGREWISSPPSMWIW